MQSNSLLRKLGFVAVGIFAGLGMAVLQPVDAARFEIRPATAAFPVECTRSFEIYADATGESSNAADLILFYEPSKIVIEDQDPDIPGKQVQTGNAYQAYASNQVDEGLGRIRMTAFSIGNNLTTDRIYARVEFSTLPGVTSTTFTIQYTGVGDTLDSNIANSVNNLDLLTGVQNATYTFSPGLCEEDNISPNIEFIDPPSGANGVPLDQNVRIRLTDNLSGVDLSTLEIIINGDIYTIDSDEISVSGDSLDYTISINPINDFLDGAPSTIYVRVNDFAGNSRARTNVFNIPPADPGDPGDPVVTPPSTCDCGDPVSYLLNSVFDINTGSPFLDDLIGGTLNDLGVTGTGAALAGILLAANLLATLLPLLSLLNAPGLLISILSYFLGKRHDRPWGLILDASNSQPVPFATCRLYVAETTNLITQTVSDTDGRYGFVMSPGSYRLEVNHNEYGIFTENFVIPEGETAHLKDIRLIPKSMQKNVNQSRYGQMWEDFWNRAKILWKTVQPILFVLGFTLSLLSIIISPGLLNFIIFGLYILAGFLYLVSKFNRAPKFASVVDAATGLRIPYAVIKFYDTEKWNLVDTQVTNGNGQFDFYGDTGEYGILVAVRGYKFPSEKQTDMDLVEDKYSGMLKTTLRKGRNRVTLLVDPISSGTAITNSLEPSLRKAAKSAKTDGKDSEVSELPDAMPTTPGNLPTPFGEGE